MERMVFSWIIEAEIYRLKKAIAAESEPDNRRSLEEQLQQKQQQLPEVLAREYGSAFTN